MRAVDRDGRDDPEVAALFQELPARRHRPFVGGRELRLVLPLLRQLPELQYPVASAGELVEQLGGRAAILDVYGIPAPVGVAVRGMPASFFPIASVENLVEKIAELLRASPRTVAIVRELGRLRPRLPRLKFPIRSADELLRGLGPLESLPVDPRSPLAAGAPVDRERIRSWVTTFLTPAHFPIRSEPALYLTALQILFRRSRVRAA